MREDLITIKVIELSVFVYLGWR